MARFSAIAKGTRARHPVLFPTGEGALPLPSVDDAGKLSYAEGASAVQVDVRVLSASELSDALAAARAHAIAKGVTDPRDGNPIYDLAEMAFTIVAACVDHDSPEAAPVPFFDSAEQVLAEVDRDRIAWLFESYQVWADSCSPKTRNVSPGDLVGHLRALGVAEDEAPFVQLSPGMQWLSVRILARLWLASQTVSSSSISPSEPSIPSDKSVSADA